MTQAKVGNTLDGYHGQVLRVDVTQGEGRMTPIEPSVLRQFLGGSGLGTYLLLSQGAAKCDPLSPEAPLVFVFSPLVGGPLTTSAKFAVVCKSPLTGRINDSLASSGFAIAGKKAGCDCLVITGRAAEPSIVVIDNGAIRLEPAGDLWGESISQTQQRLKQQFGRGWQSAVIGPAGEKQVLFATISHDGRHAGRGGTGAVLGAKNIKAIVVRGEQNASWAEPEKLTALAKTISAKSLGPATAKYRELGTAANLLLFNRLKALPTRNFQQSSFDEVGQLAPETLSKNRKKTQTSCAACTIGCEHIYSLSSDSSKEKKSGVRVEYENLFALGPMMEIGDAEVVLRASQLCDELGLDTISTGGVIAFAAECVERGLLDAKWLKFGDGQVLLKAIGLIGRREGLGDALAEGSRNLAMQLGGDAISFAPQVKGLELPGYDPRAMQTMALGFATATRGADHNRSSAYEVDFSDQVDRLNISPQAAKLAADAEDRAALMDSLILCKFLRGVFKDLFAEAAEMLRLSVGWEIDALELKKTSQRIVAARKLFNIQAGWQPSEDTLPERFFAKTPSNQNGSRHLSREHFQQAIETYNLHRGWSAEGWLEEDLLEELDLLKFV